MYIVLYLFFSGLCGKILINSIKKEEFKYLAIYLFLTLFFIIAFAIIIDSFGIINTNDTKEIGMNVILNFLTVVIFGPIVEELMYRFFISSGLVKVNKCLAHILTAFIF